MAVTNQRNTSRLVIVDPDRSTSSGKEILRKCSTDSGGSGSDDGCGPPNKRSGRSTKLKDVKFTRNISSFDEAPAKCENKEEHDVDAKAKAYLDKRVMTPTQEMFNAITMIPGMIYSIYFCWMVAGHQQGNSEWADVAQEKVENGECFDSQAFPYVAALPPLAVSAGALGTLVHSSFSVLYHWKCATSLEPSKRIKHWSRRLDHASMHLACVGAAYATSGRTDYFLLNLAFNLDSGLKQVEEKVQPRRNLTRLAMSIILYVLPTLIYGHYNIFTQFAVMFAVGGWLFVKYPFGGWSHGLFHIVITLLPHLVMTAGMQLESSQLQLTLAAKCAGMAPVDSI